MKKILLLSIFTLLSSVVYSQELTVRSFELRAVDMAAKLDPVLDLNDDPCALVRVAIASEDVVIQGNVVKPPIYVGGEWLVYIPAKTRRIKITQADCLPLTFEFTEVIEQSRTYELRIKMPDLSGDKVKTIVLPTISVAKNQYAYGIMVGFVKKSGAYVRFKSDFTKLDPSFDISDSEMVEGDDARWFTGKEQRKRWAITAGYVQRVAKPFYLYFGAGYGERVLAWETVDGSLGKVVSFSHTGYEVELGAILRFGPVAISAGVQTNQFEYYEANISFGTMF